MYAICHVSLNVGVQSSYEKYVYITPLIVNFSLRTQTYFRLSEPVTAGNTSAFAGYVLRDAKKKPSSSFCISRMAPSSSTAKHQSRCWRSRHRIRRADRLLGPSMLARLLFLLPLKIQVVLLFQLGQTLRFQLKIARHNKSNTAFLKISKSLWAVAQNGKRDFSL